MQRVGARPILNPMDKAIQEHALNRNPAPERLCDHPECLEAGLHRAPKSRDRLRDYYWFCKLHAREYNAAWDYCKGFTADQIEAHIRNDSCWGRPTWPMGLRLAATRMAEDLNRKFDADFGGLDGEKEGSGFRAQPGPDSQHPFAQTPEEAAAYRTLGFGKELTEPLTLTELKARYKELAKRLHPDLNGGDEMAEERLKAINHAYAVLREVLAGSNR